MEMNPSSLMVVLGMVGVILTLIFDRMRPGFTLFVGALFFAVTGVISTDELLHGFANRSVATIAILFLVGEGVRQSGSLSYAVRRFLPRRKGAVGWLMAQILPFIAMISSVLNNTAVVIIFAPIFKRWAERLGISPTKVLIPLSYATILGGLCTLIGTSTNMVINGMMTDSGYRSFTMFEIGQVGGVIALVGLVYICIFGNKLLPDAPHTEAIDLGDGAERVEVIIASRFPGLNSRSKEFDFQRHYGAKILAIKKRGFLIRSSIEEHIFEEGDTLVLEADSAFVRTWRSSSAFYVVSSSVEDDELQRRTPTNRKWLGVSLLFFLLCGSMLGEVVQESMGMSFDILQWIAVIMVIMAVAKLFPAKRYTKYISWDILIAIASAFAISRAIANSGLSELMAQWIVNITCSWGAVGAMAVLYIVTMLLTELITNNAAVAICFPVAVALAQRLGVDPMPFFIAISIAASASFSTPIGYQTNLIVQGIGGYRFIDYLKIGMGLNIITFVISLLLIPRIWNF